MPDCIYVLCVKGIFGRLKPCVYFYNKAAAEQECKKYQATCIFKRYVIKTVYHSLTDNLNIFIGR